MAVPPEAVIGVYVWRPEHLSRTFLRVAFSGELLSHDPGRTLDHGILRTRWLDRSSSRIPAPGCAARSCCSAWTTSSPAPAIPFR